MITTGKIILDPLISAHFRFEDYLEAYAYIGENSQGSMKVMIDL